MFENSEVVDGNGDPPKRKRLFDLKQVILGFGYGKNTFDCFLCHCTDISSVDTVRTFLSKVKPFQHHGNLDAL